MQGNIRSVAIVSCLAAMLVCAITACDNSCSENDSATCFVMPYEEVRAFEVTVTTANDPTISEIYFCYQLKSTAGWTCLGMDNGKFHNDFAIGETDHYKLKVTPPIAPGDFERFRIAMEESESHHDWDIAALTVLAVTASDREILIYHDDDINCPFSIDEGESYWPRECPY